MSEQSAVVGGKFACPACGKRYAWKAQLAGKKAKCTCGATVVVPQAAEAAADDALYDVAATPPPAPAKRAPARVVAPAPVAAPVVVPQAAAAAPALDRGGLRAMGYVTPRRFDDQTKSRRWRDRSQDPINPQRDIYLPAGLVIAGFLGMLAWVTLAADVGPFGIVLVGMATGFATAIKTVVLVALALLAAPMFGLSYGPLRTSMGKFAAVIIVSDMLLLWLGVATNHLAGPNSGNAARGTTMLATLLLAVAMIGLLVRYLFDMEWDETALLALPMAFGSLVLGLVLKVIAFVVLVLLLGASRGGAAPPVGPTFAGAPILGGGAANASTADGDEEGDDEEAEAAAVVPAPPVQIRPTPQDQQVAARLRGNAGLVEAREWAGDYAADPRRQRLAEMFYNRGAQHVYFDVTVGSQSHPARGFVELPTDASERAECFKVYAAYCKRNEVTPDPESVKDGGQRYLVLELKKPGDESK